MRNKIEEQDFRSVHGTWGESEDDPSVGLNRDVLLRFLSVNFLKKDSRGIERKHHSITSIPIFLKDIG